MFAGFSWLYKGRPPKTPERHESAFVLNVTHTHNGTLALFLSPSHNHTHTDTHTYTHIPPSTSWRVPWCPVGQKNFYCCLGSEINAAIVLWVKITRVIFQIWTVSSHYDTVVHFLGPRALSLCFPALKKTECLWPESAEIKTWGFMAGELDTFGDKIVPCSVGLRNNLCFRVHLDSTYAPRCPVLHTYFEF